MAAQVRIAAQIVTPAAPLGPLVFVPALGPGAGIGHLKRCLSLLAEAGDRGALFLERRAYDDREDIRKLLGAVPPRQLIFDPDRLPAGACLVFDRRETDPALFDSLAGRFLTIGLDEGGLSRARFSLLIDTLPMILSRLPANLTLFPFRPASRERRTFRFPFQKILVSFGGEDRAVLTGILLDALLAAPGATGRSVTVVEGPLFGDRHWPAGVTVLRACPNLADIIGEYDLLFTHFGLSAYESLDRGVPVVLFNPSDYHRRLGRAAGMVEIGVGKVDRGRLHRLLGTSEEHERALAAFRSRYRDRPSLPDFILSFQPQGETVCPVCGRASGRALDRFPLKTYFRCARCGMIRLVYWGRPKEYAADYFNAEYKAQYGKTYLEDFGHIKAMAWKRLDIIEKLARRSSSASVLLDVGAAYGPFLDAARERGFAVSGLEFSDEAAGHIRDRLGIPCLTGDFLDKEIGVRLREKSYDIISMWYVIEHFVPTGEALAMANGLLKPGGLFALATPSASGISFRKSRRLFLENSPDDHFTVWTPRSARRTLRRFGFRVEKIVVTGHHPERFSGRARGRFVSSFFLLLSRLFGLGDTFEIYARKIKDCS